jgi:hypothetical protein
MKSVARSHRNINNKRSRIPNSEEESKEIPIVLPILRLKREFPLSLISSFLSRTPFNLQRTSLIALETGNLKKTPFVTYDQFHLCGFTFFCARLRQSDKDNDFWVPSCPRFDLFPLVDSISINDCRFFLNKREARRYTMFCLIFHKKVSYVRQHILSQIFEKDDRKKDSAYLETQEASSLRRSAVAYDTDSLPRAERKERIPFLGFLEYGDGAVFVRLLKGDGDWMPNSKFYLI